MIRESVLAATLLTGSNMADAISTQHVVQAGGYERSNPWLYGRYGERVVPMKLVVSAVETGVFVALRKKHKKTAWFCVGVVVVANFVYVRHNEIEALKGRRSRAERP